MSPLSIDQKQLIFDYCLGLARPEENTEAESLIASNKQAAEIHAKLKAALSPLQSVEIESCPDELVEAAVRRANSLAHSEQQLQELIADEQSRTATVRRSPWPEWAKRLATAAVFMIAGSLVITMFNIMTRAARQKTWQQQCKLQMSNIFRGLDNYINDHDGSLPAVAASVGAPWWKVGYQGRENHSNTRPLWMLVKMYYVNAPDFACPGSTRGEALRLDTCCMPEYNDFPGREHMTYSFKLWRQRDKDCGLCSDELLMADQSPVFENLPDDYSKDLMLSLNEKLKKLNSSNHRRHGQNVLRGDGAVKYLKNRLFGTLKDDIYTLQNKDVYQGWEVPASDNDFFLAP